MSGTSAPPPAGDPRRQKGGQFGDEPTEPMLPLPPGWTALPAAQPGQPALPAPHPGELALPAAAPTPLLLPAPGATSASSQTGPTASVPLPPNPWFQSHHWTLLILGVSLVLLAVCALPVWTFGLWSFWADNSHAPPPILATLNPGGQGASDVAWSPDGRYLAEQITLAGKPAAGAVVLWDTQTHREVRRFIGADGGLALAWSPDGIWLATTNGTQTLIWNASGVETPGGNVLPVSKLAAPDPHAAITGLAWAKDGLTLAMVDEDGLGIWQPLDGSTWQQIHYFSDSPCATILCGRGLLWSPDGRWLLASPWHATDGSSGVGIWDTQTWTEQSLLAAAEPLAWSPDGSLVVVRSSDETTLSAVRAGSWKAAWSIDPNQDVRQSYNVYPEAAGWSSDGAWLAGSMDGWVDLWPTNTRQSAWVWEEQQQSQGIYTATSLAWSPNAQTLAVTTDGQAQITLYDLSNPSPPGVGPPGF